jgi:hypothetical protein
MAGFPGQDEINHDENEIRYDDELFQNEEVPNGNGDENLRDRS